MGRTNLVHYHFLQSPWSYLGFDRLLEVASRHGVAVRHVPLLPSDIFPATGGTPLNKRHTSRQSYRLLELERWSREFGVPLVLHPHHFPVDDRLAASCVIAARDMGLPVDGLVRAMLAAIWAEERDLADPETLAALIEGIGLSARDVLAKAQDTETSQTLAEDTTSAIALGVFGAPTYVLNGERFWGQDRIEALDKALSAL
ncbi:MAG: 2-hydroxychromene-2-carboxylate isomerase [Rhodospirillum sp.]|nr:2-hydroxychromene-2-carboxylate isomerase [Rhodospirillum sp.]MCF8491733.1 2-hydroxychromene-2-carboxylate isomerase [Rhodospirillum sp.]MCF8499446.1 2-hydroxychromene-2-carboxylate isomerase [Rhodospirillum sp.]